MDPTAPPGATPEHESTLPLALFRALHEHSSDVITILEPDGWWRSSSPAGTRLLGWPTGYDPGPLGIFAFLHPDDVDAANAAFEEVVNGRRDPDEVLVLRIRALDGSWHHFENRARNLADDPHVRGIVVTSRDVTEHKDTAAKIRLLYEVLEASTDLVLLCSKTGIVLYANAIARDLLHIGEGDDPVVTLERYVTAESAELLGPITEAVGTVGRWTGELTLVTAGRVQIPVASTVQRHQNDAGRDTFISVIAHDISELKLTQARLEHQATHDPLTELPNRARFQALGDRALARANRYGTTVAVLFLDLDRFKPVNDSFGHPTGDELLVEVAERLRRTIRRGDVVARFGGDEFVVLCEHPAGQTEMCELAARLIATVSEPVSVHGNEAHVGASVGIAIGGGSRVTVDTLIRDADAALYRAKEQGRGHAVLFGEWT